MYYLEGMKLHTQSFTHMSLNLGSKDMCIVHTQNMFPCMLDFGREIASPITHQEIQGPLPVK